MDEFVDWLRSRLRIAGVIGAAALIALGVWVELRGGEAPPILPRQDLVRLALFADARGPALPRLLPPDATGARGAVVREVPVVLVAARDEPTVAVCSAPVVDCRRALPRARTVPRRTADDMATVLVLADDDEPTGARDLSPGARDFWRAVPLIRTTPEWLAAVPPR